MSVIGKLVKRMRERNSNMKEIQQNDRIHNLIEERKKNANEREFEKIMEKKRQEKIAEFLKNHREKETREMWEDKSVIQQPNIFTGHKSVLTDNPDLFSMSLDSSKSKNMFFG